MLNAYDLHDIVLGDGAKSLSFEINAHYFELCDHEVNPGQVFESIMT